MPTMTKVLQNILQFRHGPTSRRIPGRVFGQSSSSFGTKSGGKCKRPRRMGLPWESNEYEKCLQRKDNTCKDCIPPEVRQRLTITECEQRRIDKCMKVYKDCDKCRFLGPNLSAANKVYPMIHAVDKRYLPGCPKAGWQDLQKQAMTVTC